ncbi:hypothetical protein WJX74_008017 [Apatococcus lobatus]|uniref:Uncharacterized protein n=1 Tax=Apatococcus lobatus TaxID=904363 RepID=A0AAW1RK40_9CHLO
MCLDLPGKNLSSLTAAPGLKAKSTGLGNELSETQSPKQGAAPHVAEFKAFERLCKKWRAPAKQTKQHAASPYVNEKIGDVRIYNQLIFADIEAFSRIQRTASDYAPRSNDPVSAFCKCYICYQRRQNTPFGHRVQMGGSSSKNSRKASNTAQPAQEPQEGQFGKLYRVSGAAGGGLNSFPEFRERGEGQRENT